MSHQFSHHHVGGKNTANRDPEGLVAGVLEVDGELHPNLLGRVGEGLQQDGAEVLGAAHNISGEGRTDAAIWAVRQQEQLLGEAGHGAGEGEDAGVVGEGATFDDPFAGEVGAVGVVIDARDGLGALGEEDRGANGRSTGGSDDGAAGDAGGAHQGEVAEKEGDGGFWWSDVEGAHGAVFGDAVAVNVVEEAQHLGLGRCLTQNEGAVVVGPLQAAGAFQANTGLTCPLPIGQHRPPGNVTGGEAIRSRKVKASRAAEHCPEDGAEDGAPDGASSEKGGD